MQWHITALPDGTGIIRHFRIPKITSPLRVAGHGEIDSEMSNGVAVLSRIRPRPSPSLTGINTENEIRLFSIGLPVPAPQAASVNDYYRSRTSPRPRGWIRRLEGSPSCPTAGWPLFPSRRGVHVRTETKTDALCRWSARTAGHHSRGQPHVGRHATPRTHAPAGYRRDGTADHYETLSDRLG